MATSSQVSEFRQSQKDVVALAYRDLVTYWRTLDLTDPKGSILSLEKFLPELIQDYGQVAASVAADFYDSLRAESPVARTAYASVLGDAIPIQQIRSSARWAVTPLFQPRNDFAETTFNNVVSITDRLVKAQSRATIVTNAHRDPARARYARVPTGRETCAFCLMLASRGAVYASEDTAGGEYHGHCDCIPTPVWSNSELPDDYDLEGLRQDYAAAKKESPTGALKGADGLLANLRDQQSVH